jgi:hypothetical protein
MRAVSATGALGRHGRGDPAVFDLGSTSLRMAPTELSHCFDGPARSHPHHEALRNGDGCPCRRWSAALRPVPPATAALFSCRCIPHLRSFAKSSGLRAGLLHTAPERKRASAHLGFRQPMHVHPQPWRSVTLTRRPEDLSLAMEELD